MHITEGTEKTQRITEMNFQTIAYQLCGTPCILCVLRVMDFSQPHKNHFLFLFLIMNDCNDPKLKCWVDVARDSDFPIQNLPFGIFKTRYLSAVAGVAIGNYVLDLVYLHENGFLDGLV